MSQAKKLVVIDGKSVFYRGYFAMPDLANSQGEPTGAVHGFTMMALRIMRDIKPDYVVVAWDKSQTNIRSRIKLYPKYKANRKPMPEPMREQIGILRELCAAFSWPLLEVDDFEADDIMGTLRAQALGQNLAVTLVTSDLDMLQLVDGHTKVLALKRGLTNTILYDQQRLAAEYQMTPSQFIDYKSLRGDPSDNIPGVKGIGEKTAKQLIADFGSLDEIYRQVEQIKGATKTKLIADEPMARLSRKLVQIKCDAPVDLDLLAADVLDCHPEQIDELFSRLNFRRLRAELPEWMSAKQNLFAPDQSSSTTAINSLKVSDLTKIAVDSAMVAVFGDIVIVSPDSQTAHRVPLDRIKIKSVSGYDVKPCLKLLTNCYSEPKPAITVEFDIMVAAFLLNPLQRQASLAELADAELNMKLPESEATPLSDEFIGKYMAVLWRLKQTYQQQLEQTGRLAQVAAQFEWPLLPLLARLECFGVKLDTDYLAEMSVDFAQRIDILRQKIYQEASSEFNINSPQQLQTVLFETLGLPTNGIKKTKTGYSTGASELDKLRGLHPIIDFITHYRELTKLKSTYIDALPKLVDKNSRLHTTLNQTIAQTGRLSSVHPNLQNIPVRTDEGKAIRRAFIASSGNVLVSADYSQFELRLAAILAGEPEMITAFNAGIDIHQLTAAQMYEISPESVNKDQRRSAKAVNFGIMYGQGPHGLAQGTGMSMAEAKEFIQKYFAIRPNLRKYIDELRSQARDQGYVETWFGRRRPTPDVNSSNFAVREGAYRAAINMPMQGTAADIMKLAMIAVENKLDPDCRQILQIHDSILVECPIGKSTAVKSLLQSTMENICPDLGIGLRVDVTAGSHWGEL